MNIIKKSIFVIAVSLTALSCGESTETKDAAVNENAEINIEEQTIAKNVNASEFKSLIETGGFLLDVRTPGEVGSGSIEGNTNINFNDSNFKSELGKLDKNKTVLVYCASGGRSGKAMEIMQSMGFKEVYNLNGGYSGWPNK